MDIAAEFMAASINAFEANKRLADRAVEQVPDDRLHTALDANTNSIAVIMKHVAGNLMSRWTDFLTTDGEKPWRNRDDEFVDTFRSREEVLEYWEGVWKESLIVRFGPEEGEEALKEPHVSEFDITGRAMKGWVLVAPEGSGADDELRGWVQRAVKFVAKLPAK